MSQHQLSLFNRMAAGVFGGIVLAASAATAHAADSKSIEARYKEDVANCNAGRTNQSKQVCLREAGAARVEARRNRLMRSGSNYDSNAVQRCQRLPASDRAACEAQMAGQGQTYGSVQGGGVLREMTIQVPAGTPGSTPAPGYAPPAQGYSPAAAGAGYAPAAAPAPGNMAPPPVRRHPMPAQRPMPMPGQQTMPSQQPMPMSGQPMPSQQPMPAQQPMAPQPGVRY